MWFILLEAGIALCIVAAFVWWVIPKKPRDKNDSAKRARNEKSPPS